MEPFFIFKINRCKIKKCAKGFIMRTLQVYSKVISENNPQTYLQKHFMFIPKIEIIINAKVNICHI